MPDSVLQELMSTIESRKAEPTERSYTAQLIAKGLRRIGEKVTEEAAELVEASNEPDGSARSEHICAEAADLLYHVLVLLAASDLTLADVERVLASRFGVSGLDEKAARDGGE